MRDIYGQITDRIIAALENGVQPWFKPWDGQEFGEGFVRPLRATGQPYHGINVIMLWITSLDKGYESRYWMTYKQAQALGGQVRWREQSTPVVYANKFVKKVEGEDDRLISFLRTYNVFNCDQIDGLPDKFYAPKVVIQVASTTRNNTRNELAETFFANLGMTVRHGGSRAYYSPSEDAVHLPNFEVFHSARDYYCTKGHESIHWTKHESRLDRDLGRKRWGDEGYALEELVAELGAAFLAADLEIDAVPRTDHASYLASWLKVLKHDKRAIFTMAGYAEKAVAYLHSKQPGTKVEVANDLDEDIDEMAEAA